MFFHSFIAMEYAFSLFFYWALSIQQKFRFEISEILRVQWNGTFRLHRPDPSHRALGYCSCKQDTEERYWGQQFCQMERNISDRPTEMTRPVKEDHLQSWSRIFRSDQTEMVRSISCSNRNYRNFGLNGKRPLLMAVSPDGKDIKLKTFPRNCVISLSVVASSRRCWVQVLLHSFFFPVFHVVVFYKYIHK